MGNGRCRIRSHPRSLVSKNRSPLPADADFLEPEADAPVPGDIGLGAPVGGAMAPSDVQALQRAVASADRLGQAASPMRAEDLTEESPGARTLSRAQFLKKYPPPSNVRIHEDANGNPTVGSLSR
jgi:hypothetical protein